MTGRIAKLWGLLAILSFGLGFWRGWDNVSGLFICYTVIIYYGENILNRLEEDK